MPDDRMSPEMSQALDRWIVENGQRQQPDERDMGDDDEIE